MKKLILVLLILGVWLMPGVRVECFEDLAWENISAQILEVNALWVNSRNPRIILVGADRGVFRTEDRGRSWQAVLFGAGRRVNFLYADPVNEDFIYSACSSGLFLSSDQGKTFRQIYQGDSEDELGCLCLIKLDGERIYLGTQTGLIISRDNGRIWHKYPGKLGNLLIQAIAVNQAGNHIYLATPEGVYQIDSQQGVQRILVSRQGDLDDETVEALDAQDSQPDNEDYQLSYVCIDSNKPGDIYAAVTNGVFKSGDSGQTWKRLSGAGISGGQVRFITVSDNSGLWAVTKSGIFVYNNNRWQKVSLKLIMRDIRFLEIDNYGNFYAGGDKGLFRSSDYPRDAHSSSLAGIDREPDIRQVQQAAIKYAQVIAPEQINAHRRLARLKAILPDLSVDYDKTIYGSASTKVNGEYGNSITGPRDWGVSLKWDLGDLIWSEQQRLIDSQVRLMVKLRQDILDEVTRLYFERRRLKLELISSRELTYQQEQDKKLTIDELTALINGLTGGCFLDADVR